MLAPSKEFTYSSEWYKKDILEWSKELRFPADLFRYYDNNKRDRIKKIYSPVTLKGYGLELGFNFGNSLFWLFYFHREIVMDAIDFNEGLFLISKMLKKLYENRLKDIWIGDSRLIPSPDDHYDFVNCCDFFEHLPEEVYWDTIKEVKRVLKPGGILGVHVGQPQTMGHIRIVPPKVTRAELESKGFIARSNYLFHKDLI